MAKCRECGAEIPEGEEYCENCFSKLNTVKDSESYLDSLLNAVMTEEPERREVVFRKKKDNPSVSVSPKKEAVPVEEVSVPDEEAVPVPEEENPFKLFEEEEETAVPEEEDLFKLLGTEPEEEDSFEPFEMEPAEEEAVSGLEPAEEAVVPEAAEAASGTEQVAAENDKETKEELPELKNYSIFDEIDESDISRMFGGICRRNPVKPQRERKSLLSRKKSFWRRRFPKRKKGRKLF